MPCKNHCLNLPSSILDEHFPHNFAAFLVSLLWALQFLPLVYPCYIISIFSLCKVEYTKKENITTAQSK